MAKGIYDHSKNKGTRGLHWKVKNTSKMGGRHPTTEFKKGVPSWNKGRIGYGKFNKGKVRTMEMNEKQSLIRKGRVAWNKGKLSFYPKSYFKTIGLRGLLQQQNSKQPTSIEKAVYEYLVLKGVIFEKQKLINDKFLVDAYIPSLNLVIEADGKYWHNLDRVVKKDKAENAYLKKCGFNLLRLSEEEIKTGKFKERMVI